MSDSSTFIHIVSMTHPLQSSLFDNVFYIFLSLPLLYFFCILPHRYTFRILLNHL